MLKINGKPAVAVHEVGITEHGESVTLRCTCLWWTHLQCTPAEARAAANKHVEENAP